MFESRPAAASVVVFCSHSADSCLYRRVHLVATEADSSSAHCTSQIQFEVESTLTYFCRGPSMLRHFRSRPTASPHDALTFSSKLCRSPLAAEPGDKPGTACKCKRGRARRGWRKWRTRFDLRYIGDASIWVRHARRAHTWIVRYHICPSPDGAGRRLLASACPSCIEAASKLDSNFSRCSVALLDRPLRGQFVGLPDLLQRRLFCNIIL